MLSLKLTIWLGGDSWERHARLWRVLGEAPWSTCVAWRSHSKYPCLTLPPKFPNRSSTRNQSHDELIPPAERAASFPIMSGSEAGPWSAASESSRWAQPSVHGLGASQLSNLRGLAPRIGPRRISLSQGTRCPCRERPPASAPAVARHHARLSPDPLGRWPTSAVSDLSLSREPRTRLKRI